jgi:hypothetical protein
MSLVQSFVLGVFFVLAVLTLSAGLNGSIGKRICAAGLVVWSLGGVCVVWPHTVELVAQQLGLERGTDLLLYGTTLTTAVALAYVYMRFRRLERQLTLLVRRLAIQGADERIAAARLSVPSESFVAPRWEASDAKRGA